MADGTMSCDAVAESACGPMSAAKTAHSAGGAADGGVIHSACTNGSEDDRGGMS